MNIFDKALLQRTQRKLSLQRIQNELTARSIHGFSRPTERSSERPIVSTASVEFRLFDSLGEYISNTNQYVNIAASRQSYLLCMPQFFQLQALSLLPGYYRYIKPPKGSEKLTPFTIIRRMDDETLQLLNDTTLMLLCELAKIYSIYIVSGAEIVREKDELFLRSHLIAPTGEILGYQDKIFETSDCANEPLSYANGLTIFETEIGKICILIGGDCAQWALYKQAVESGAHLICAPTATRHPYNTYLAMRDILCNVQFYYAYGVKSCYLGGDAIGLQYYGKSMITAPYKITTCLNGILSIAGNDTRSNVVTAQLDYPQLEDYSDVYLGR